jgi:hypothetical protein
VYCAGGSVGLQIVHFPVTFKLYDENDKDLLPTHVYPFKKVKNIQAEKCS